MAAKHTPNKENAFDIVKLKHGYYYQPDTQQLFLETKEIVLTKKELELITFLCKHKHQVLSFDEIIKQLWEDNTSFQTLRSLIYRIRQKCCADIIVSVSKRGYKISL